MADFSGNIGANPDPFFGVGSYDWAGGNPQAGLDWIYLTYGANAAAPPTPSAPYLLNLTPSDSDITETEGVRFEVYTVGTFTRIIVEFEYPGFGVTETAYDTEFRTPYTNFSSITPSTNAGNNGYIFVVRRSPVWPDSPKLRLFAVNSFGLEL